MNMWSIQQVGVNNMKIKLVILLMLFISSEVSANNSPTSWQEIPCFETNGEVSILFRKYKCETLKEKMYGLCELQFQHLPLDREYLVTLGHKDAKNMVSYKIFIDKEGNCSGSDGEFTQLQFILVDFQGSLFIDAKDLSSEKNYFFSTIPYSHASENGGIYHHFSQLNLDGTELIHNLQGFSPYEEVVLQIDERRTIGISASNIGELTFFLTKQNTQKNQGGADQFFINRLLEEKQIQIPFVFSWEIQNKASIDIILHSDPTFEKIVQLSK